MADLEQVGLDAVDRFITTWNSRNPDDWAASLNYPHVRPSPIGPTRVAPDAADYAAHVDFNQVIQSGWDHSEWDYKHVLHTSPRKIHVAGQWSRYNAAGEVILTTPIVYVVTHADGQWGIQSRFGSDYVDEDTDTTEMQSRGLNLIQDFVNKQSLNDRDSCAELLNYPHFVIGVGELTQTQGPEDFALPDRIVRVESMMAVQTGRMSMNAAVELTTATASGTRHLQSVVHINNRDGHLGIQAWSMLDPDETVDD